MNEIAPPESHADPEPKSSPTKVFLIACGAILAVVLLSVVLAKSVLPAEPVLPF
jgi:hypothetical protein